MYRYQGTKIALFRTFYDDKSLTTKKEQDAPIPQEPGDLYSNLPAGRRVFKPVRRAGKFSICSSPNNYPYFQKSYQQNRQQIR